jgi:iron complex outermembrane receptor protein
MKSSIFSSRLALAASPLALSLALLSSPAFAQDAQPADSTTTATEVETQSAPADAATQTDDTAAEDEIIVTGFRAALQNAVNAKKRNEQVIESVSAEDIGKLPDASIAESIARLPGLTSQRLPGPGRSALITVRGFGPDFSVTTLNGRLQTSTGDARGVEFDQYPSEVVSAVDIYKTQNARLIGQALAGTVDIRTIRPLTYNKRVLAIGVKGVAADIGRVNPDSEKYGYRVNATFVDRFLNDRLGIAASVAYVDEPYQTHEQRAWGYPEVTDGVTTARVLGGLETNNTSTQLTRLGVNGTVQYEVLPELVFTADGFYSNFKDDQIRRGVEVPLQWGGAALSNVRVVDGVVVSGTFTNVPSVVNNKAYNREADLYSLGGNLRYDGNNGFNAMVDVGWSKTDRVETDLQTNAGTGPGALGANDTLTFELGDEGYFFTNNLLDYSDPTRIFITDPNGWGGGAPGGRQHGYLNNRTVEDEILQISGELEQEFDNSFLRGVRVGASHIKRDKTLTPDEFYLQIASGALQAPVPQQFLVRPVESYVGLGNIISYDPRALLDSGFFSRVANTSAGVLAKGYSLTERVLGLYGMVDLEQEFGGGVLTGNVGVRAERTDQQSDGFVVTSATGLQPFSDGDKFWDILPSLNLAFRTNSDLVIRAAAARQIMRPRFDQMSTEFGYGFNPQQARIEGSGGNPRLQPYRANSYDLTLEQYFGTRGYVAVQLFYKDLKNFIYSDQRVFDYSGFPNPGLPADLGGGPVTNLIGVYTSPINIGSGAIYGWEAAGTLPLETIVSALEGFGVTGGVSYTVSSISRGEGKPDEVVAGYSRWVGNATAYYERAGFNIRGSMRYRSKYLGDFTDFDGSANRRTVRPETIYDAQIGYDFQEGSALRGLSVFLQGSNLTDEPFVSYDNLDPTQILNFQRYGRRFTAGATFKF